jgi:probable rRNA maturation factor
MAAGLRPAGLEVVVVVGDDGLLRRLNRRWRQRDRPTDVLSFAYSEGGVASGPDAEVYVSLDRAAAQARALGHSRAQEFVRLVVHGLVHLQGHDHELPAQAERMRAAERRVLRRLAASHPGLASRPLVPRP